MVKVLAFGRKARRLASDAKSLAAEIKANCKDTHAKAESIADLLTAAQYIENTANRIEGIKP